MEREEERVSPRVEPPKKRRLSPAEKLINDCSQAHENGCLAGLWKMLKGGSKVLGI
jgi:hypothetical protein